ncbi:pentapeptide repeat-containing protein [Rhodococcus triatomae]|nr:hypothetical protein G419_05942 [Rhodococcus triatomae BKS 15-14]
MNKSTITTLRRRWTDADVEDLRDQLIRQSRVVRPPHTLHTRWPDTDDGSVDLRGIDAGDRGLDIRYVTVQRLDLRFARGPVSVYESELFDCRFDSVVLTRQPTFTRRLERCTFQDATLTRLALGPAVVDCDFTGAKARRLRSVPNTVFERCTFDATDLSGAEFRDTSFVDCTMRDTRFSAATTFERCSFTRTDMEFGASRVTRTTSDGDATPDRWDGRSDAEAALDRYAVRYARAVAAGNADTVPLDPE